VNQTDRLGLARLDRRSGQGPIVRRSPVEGRGPHVERQRGSQRPILLGTPLDGNVGPCPLRIAIQGIASWIWRALQLLALALLVVYYNGTSRAGPAEASSLESVQIRFGSRDAFVPWKLQQAFSEVR
jgi:hypothetical protein